MHAMNLAGGSGRGLNLDTVDTRLALLFKVEARPSAHARPLALPRSVRGAGAVPSSSASAAGSLPRLHLGLRPELVLAILHALVGGAAGGAAHEH